MYPTRWRLYFPSGAATITLEAAVAEFKLFSTLGGTNLCTGATASASTIFNSSWPASKAIDSDNATYWLSGYHGSGGEPPHWLQVDLPTGAAVIQYSVTATVNTGSNTATPGTLMLQYWDIFNNVWVTTDTRTGLSWAYGETKVFTATAPALVNASTIVTSGTAATGSVSTADTAICNMALARIGISQFMDDVATDATMSGVVCRKFYADALERTLGEGVWQFLQKTVELAASGSGTLDWAYRYTYPSDCVQAETVTGSRATYLSEYYMPTGVVSSDVPFALAQNEAGSGQSILCNVSPAYLTYAGRVSNPALFPWLFKSAVAWALAVEIASPLSAAPNMAANAEKAYRIAVADALSNDGNEQQQPERCNDFTMVRL